MRKFVYFHCYTQELWAGYEKNGLIKENFGIRFPQSIRLPEKEKFNEALKKGGKLYNYIKEKNCYLYIDRLQGGSFIQNYTYSQELIEEYKQMLGDKFLGFQMHEWFSNYKGDVQWKLGDLPKEEWTEENIKKIILEKFPYPHLFLEAMTLEEMARYGKPQNWREYYENMTAIYKDRAEKFNLLPCDSYFLMYPFEAENGAKAIMPELGAQIPDMRVQICFARGVCKAYGLKLGGYYEPWGGEPFTTCAYMQDEKNEWGIKSSADFPFVTGGKNGGSSRSLQWRTHLYAYLSGAEFISEEWGGYNTFNSLETYELSEYGLVKKKFLDFVDKYPDIGEKLAPIAAVISNSAPCYTISWNVEEDSKNLFGYPLQGEELEKNRALQFAVKEIFSNAVDMQGNEGRILINSTVPDAVDMLNEHDGKALKNYQYLVDLTGESDFKEKYPNCILPSEVEEKLHELLPCKVEGGLHYLVNECESGGYYLSIFNQSGIVRTQAKGDEVLESATKTAVISLKGDRKLVPLEGNTSVEYKDGKYSVCLKGGEWLFAKI